MSTKSKISILKRSFYGTFMLVFLGILLYVSGVKGIVSFFIYMSIYGVIAYIFYIAWKTIRKKKPLSFLDFGEFFVYKASTGLLLGIIIIGGFAYYKNEISPTPMPTYHISNGEKIIVFQAMSHIGSEKFYKDIQSNLIEKKQNGYVYYFEGVKPGTQKNMKSFDKAIGIKFDKDLYKNFSKLYGVTHQDNSMYYDLVNDKDYNVDLSIDEIMEHYSKIDSNSDHTQNKEDKKSFFQNISQNNDTMDINSVVIETLSSLNDRELSILRYVNKGILNFIIGSESTQNLVMNNLANKQLFSVILDKRNEVLSSKIINSQDKKIFITYGLLHFKGVFDILKQSDNNWKISKTEYLYPIK